MTEPDEERKERIEMEIIGDAYTQDEQAMGWHIYLEETMDFPFEARCIAEQEVSPLKKGETVRVVGKPSSEPSLRQQRTLQPHKGPSETGCGGRGRLSSHRFNPTRVRLKHRLRGHGCERQTGFNPTRVRLKQGVVAGVVYRHTASTPQGSV
jgi:hypothetical protein